MTSLEQWLALAPEPPQLTRGHKWHVFLSYRSVNRPWVLKLYDVLRSLNYEVFMDQYVLPAGVSLIGALEKNLQQSASGVLIWSTDNADSEWCEQERRVFHNLTLRKQTPPFHYVVARLDASELPPFAADNLSLDFAGQESGPAGANLLRLLYGLQGAPLPHEAITLAAEVEQELRDIEARIRAAAKAGKAKRIVAVAESESMAWGMGPSLGCLAAEELIGLGANADALYLLEQLEADFPRSLRVRQLKGLALARSGDWQNAQLELEELNARGEQDPETLGILARTWMDRYRESGDSKHLRRSRDLYAHAFAMNPDNEYCGINAAAKSLLLGDTEATRRHAEAVASLVGTEPLPGRYWINATMAEAQLLLGNCAEAATLYSAALATAPEEKGSHQSTWTQAKLLLEHCCSSQEDRAAIRAVFQDLED